MSETLTQEQLPHIEADEDQRLIIDGLNLALSQNAQDSVDSETAKEIRAATINENGNLHAQTNEAEVVSAGEEQRQDANDLESDINELDLSHEEPSNLEALSIYLRDIRKTPLLTREEEVDLAKRIELGDENARHQMINANQRLVIKHAKRFQFLGVS